MTTSPKAIIVCFDGTTKDFSTKNTNIVKLHSMFSKAHPSKQTCYYQPGIGQYFETGVTSPLFAGAAQALDWSFAWYLYQHVIDGYKFLTENWSKGDQIFIFGFSRGAYVARCLAGMVQKIGLLASGNVRLLTFAYNLYKRTDREGEQVAMAFKRSFSRDVEIEFVGVFDTVSSVGLVIHRELPCTSVNGGIKKFRHALALDERRFRFGPSPWGGPIPFDSPQDFLTSPHVHIPRTLTDLISYVWWKVKHPAELVGSKALPAYLSRSGQKGPDDIAFAGVSSAVARKFREEFDKLSRTDLPKGPPKPETDVREVWFAGGHEDIGGGAVLDSPTAKSLSDITLRWMVRELISFENLIVWVPGSVEALFGLGDNDMSPNCIPAELDLQDVSAPLHDDLFYTVPILEIQVPSVWWFFEFLPLSWTWEDTKGDRYRQWRMNLARGRTIQDDYEKKPLVHTSVRQRMETTGYKPQVHLKQPVHWEPTAPVTPTCTWLVLDDQ